MGFIVVDQFKHEAVRSMLKLESVKTDTWTFRLHYKLSIFLVVFFSLAFSLVGWTTPVRCLGSTKEFGGTTKGIPEGVETYCLVQDTYTIPNLTKDERLFPGVGSLNAGQKIYYQSSYKWMYFFVFTSIILLFMPRYFWRSLENGRMKQMRCDHLHRITCRDHCKLYTEEMDKLVRYLRSHFGYHRGYAYGFVFCEFLNLVIVALMIYLWDLMSDNAFSQHGATFHAFYTHPFNRTDHLATAFPLLAKCSMSRTGPGGNMVPYDYLCVLPLNAFNERAAVLFWYYYWTLACIDVLMLGLRMWIMFSVRIRVMLLSGLTSMMAKEDVASLINGCSYADWFVIYQLGNVLEPLVFKDVLEKLSSSLVDSV